AVFFFSLITLGIYSIVWEVKTKGELTKLGAEIPTSWLIIVPFANLYWLWKYCQGVDKVSNGKISTVLSLVLLVALGFVGMAILQSMYNDLSPATVGGSSSQSGSMPPATPAVTPVTDSASPSSPTPPNPQPPVTPQGPTAA
ncbi:MAG TPA: DUF4234 domain-containing protein, partial [Candidatus Saccharimonadales bacterium]|nr:DUF4234 domain-containing protein [Candidatus Saccharimonadales bacterium]